MVCLWSMNSYYYSPQTKMANGILLKVSTLGIKPIVRQRTWKRKSNDVAIEVRCAWMKTVTTDRNQHQSFLRKSELNSKIKRNQNLSSLQQASTDLNT